MSFYTTTECSTACLPSCTYPAPYKGQCSQTFRPNSEPSQSALKPWLKSRAVRGRGGSRLAAEGHSSREEGLGAADPPRVPGRGNHATVGIGGRLEGLTQDLQHPERASSSWITCSTSAAPSCVCSPRMRTASDILELPGGSPGPHLSGSGRAYSGPWIQERVLALDGQSWLSAFTPSVDTGQVT